MKKKYFSNSFFISACHFVGFAPLLVAVATMILIVLHIIQLRSLKAYMKRPGHHSSADYHRQPTHIFWRIVSEYLAKSDFYFIKDKTMVRVKIKGLITSSIVEVFLFDCLGPPEQSSK